MCPALPRYIPQFLGHGQVLLHVVQRLQQGAVQDPNHRWCWIKCAELTTLYTSGGQKVNWSHVLFTMACDQTSNFLQKNVGLRIHQAHTLLQNCRYSVYQSHILDRTWRATENLFKLLFTVGGEKWRKKTYSYSKWRRKERAFLLTDGGESLLTF